MLNRIGATAPPIRHPASASSYQILLRDRGSEIGVVADESGDELVHPALEDHVVLLVLQLAERGAGASLRAALAAMRAPERIEVPHDVLVAGGEGARHL